MAEWWFVFTFVTKTNTQLFKTLLACTRHVLFEMYRIAYTYFQLWLFAVWRLIFSKINVSIWGKLKLQVLWYSEAVATYKYIEQVVGCHICFMIV